MGGRKIKDFSAALRSGEVWLRDVKQPDLGKRPKTSAIHSPWVCGKSTKLGLFDKSAHWHLGGECQRRLTQREKKVSQLMTSKTVGMQCRQADFLIRCYRCRMKSVKSAAFRGEEKTCIWRKTLHFEKEKKRAYGGGRKSRTFVEGEKMLLWERGKKHFCL